MKLYEDGGRAVLIRPGASDKQPLPGGSFYIIPHTMNGSVSAKFVSGDDIFTQVHIGLIQDKEGTPYDDFNSLYEALAPAFSRGGGAIDTTEIENRIESLEASLTSISARFELIESTLDSTSSRLGEVDNSLGSMSTTLASVSSDTSWAKSTATSNSTRINALDNEPKIIFMGDISSVVGDVIKFGSYSITLKDVGPGYVTFTHNLGDSNSWSMLAQYMGASDYAYAFGLNIISKTEAKLTHKYVSSSGASFTGLRVTVFRK